jgi:hypothetical protein
MVVILVFQFFVFSSPVDEIATALEDLFSKCSWKLDIIFFRPIYEIDRVDWVKKLLASCGSFSQV